MEGDTMPVGMPGGQDRAGLQAEGLRLIQQMTALAESDDMKRLVVQLADVFRQLAPESDAGTVERFVKALRGMMTTVKATADFTAAVKSLSRRPSSEDFVRLKALARAIPESGIAGDMIGWVNEFEVASKAVRIAQEIQIPEHRGDGYQLPAELLRLLKNRRRS